MLACTLSSVVRGSFVPVVLAPLDLSARHFAPRDSAKVNLYHIFLLKRSPPDLEEDAAMLYASLGGEARLERWRFQDLLDLGDDCDLGGFGDQDTHSSTPSGADLHISGVAAALPSPVGAVWRWPQQRGGTGVPVGAGADACTIGGGRVGLPKAAGAAATAGALGLIYGLGKTRLRGKADFQHWVPSARAAIVKLGCFWGASFGEVLLRVDQAGARIPSGGSPKIRPEPVSKGFAMRARGLTGRHVARGLQTAAFSLRFVRCLPPLIGLLGADLRGLVGFVSKKEPVSKARLLTNICASGTI